MHIIAAQGQVHLIEDITQILLGRGNDFNTEDNVLKWTPLQYAIKSGSWFVADRLLERKAKIMPADIEHFIERLNDRHYIVSVLFYATAGYNFLLKFLHDVGVDINQAILPWGTTALHIAAQRRQPRTISWLIDIGANCNTADNDGCTPLFDAAHKGRLDIVRMLVQKGKASVNVCDNGGRSALDWAIKRISESMDVRGTIENTEREEIVKYLRERG
jgi:ankyrin repeat protein